MPSKKKPRKSAKPRDQVAALPLKRDDDGSFHVMLISSRRTRRWIVPKGWLVKGLKPYRAAAKEAEEEAGVIGRIKKRPIGKFDYDKVLTDAIVPCRVKVFLMQVKRQLKTWPEQKQRLARWYALDEAADMVRDAGLAEILIGFAKKNGGADEIFSAGLSR